MSSQKELEELFAYLDRLELQEKMDQQSTTTTEDQEPDSAHTRIPTLESTTLIPQPNLAEPFEKSLTTHELDVNAEESYNDFQLDGDATDNNAPAMEFAGRIQVSSTESKEIEIPKPAPTIITPPRRKTVQFNVITPLKTPQRRAPRLIFTPMKAIQPIAHPAGQDLLTLPIKPTLLGEATALDGADTRTSLSPHQIQRSLSENASLVSDDLVIDSDEATMPTSAIPNSPLAVEDILGEDDDSIASDGALSPTLHGARSLARAKKRVIYSSEDDSDGPGSTMLPQRLASSADSGAEEIEFLGEKTLQPDSQAEPIAGQSLLATKSTKRQAGRRAVARFIDDMASAAGRYEDEGSSDDDKDLDGFIVDDDYIEYEKDSAEEESDGSDFVLRYSPTTPRLTKTALKKTIFNVDLTETSDEEIPASPNLRIAPRPKARPRPTSAKSLETPMKNRSEKRAWNENKQKLAQSIMDDLDSLVFEGKLVKEWGVKAVWNNKLLTTAGRAHHKRVKLPDGNFGHDGRIELSEKVIDDEDKLKNTVAHEMCHRKLQQALATWIISGEMKNPHGAVFKSWGNKVMKARRDIEVTYEWECTTEGCDAIYRRHSKSIDIERKGCGKCRGKLRPLFKTRGAGAGSTPFQDFLKQNMKLAKTAMPKATHGEVMRALSERWKATGGAKSPAEIIQTGEDPLAVQRQHAEHWQGLALRMQELSIS
ncbi:hypothetical protein QFC21_004065 [Naganishia friedmannii]|uniref:Uncharacterized protein n=1 Tax=Naganishia friedmannii TaxID=89922 RepID=A0ACC2VJC4_9TREE|nr:hypothetical protein QFC21_004065 [Naganishia friedmannii]